MSPIYSGELEGADPNEDIGTLHTTLGQRLGAAFSESIAAMPTVGLNRMAQMEAAHGRVGFSDDPFAGMALQQEMIEHPGPDVGIEQARERVKAARLEHEVKLPQAEKIKEAALNLMLDHARERVEHATTIARGPQGFIPGALDVGTSFLVGALDPLNIAAFTIPVLGEARYGMLLAQAGTSVIGRAGVRAGVGALQGAVGSTALTPLDWLIHTSEGRDYGMANALESIIMNAGIGGLMHSTGLPLSPRTGIFGEAYRAARGDIGRPLDVREEVWNDLNRRPGEPARAADEPAREAGAPGLVPAEQAPARSEERAEPAPAAARGAEAPQGEVAGDETAQVVHLDVARQLRERGLSAEEADQNAAVFAARYATRAKRLGGARTAEELYRGEGIEVKEGGILPESGERSYAQSPTAPTFYSTVDRIVESAKQEKATPEQWLAMIRNTPGVKKEELEWLGLEDFLKEKKGTVTKQEVQEFVRQNQVQLKEVEKGEATEAQRLQDEKKQQLSAERQRLARLHDEYVQQGRPAGEIIDRMNDLHDQIRDLDYSERPGTKFHSYTLPGGENYREMLLTLPERPMTGKEGPAGWADVSNSRSRAGDQNYRSSHWDEPNVLAHVRFNDRTIDGKKTLFIEEIQSDWHQKGKREGYSVGRIDDLPEGWKVEKTYLNGAERYVVLDERGDRFAYAATEREARETALNRYNSALAKGVPDAPFKRTEDWAGLALKRMIRYAAENGYEKIAWTNGETQAARYDLSKQVNKIGARKNEDGSFRLTGETKEGNVVTIGEAVPEAKLADHIGKDLAEKVAKDLTGPGRTPSEDGSDIKFYSGADLKVGGEGMKGFYDKILPNVANKLVKKFGGKVEDQELKVQAQKLDESEFREFHVNEGEDRNGRTLYEVRNSNTGEIKDSFATRGEAERLVKNLMGSPEGEQVHVVDLSPELKKVAGEQGFPLFQTGGAEGTPQGRITLDENKAIISLFKGANESTFMHEAGHLWLDELARDAAHAKAPKQLQDDFKTVLDWLGVSKAEEIGTAEHEQWARGFEQYLMEGKAPSSKLQAAFEKFKEWLSAIYKSLTELGTPISDDIRGVMDRMLATDEEIAARPSDLMGKIGDLPPRAKEDAMRVAAAALIEGQPVKVGEMLDVAALRDPRIAESWNSDALTRGLREAGFEEMPSPVLRERALTIMQAEGLGEKDATFAFERALNELTAEKLRPREVSDATGTARVPEERGTAPATGGAVGPAVPERPGQTLAGAPATRGPARPGISDDGFRVESEADAWRRLAARAREFDEPDIVARSQEADRLQQPASTRPDKRLEAASKSEAEAKALFDAQAEYLPKELREHVEDQIRLAEQEGLDSSEVVRRAAACLAGAIPLAAAG